MSLVCRQDEQLSGLHAARMPPHGHAAPPVQHAVEEVIAVGVVPGDEEIAGRVQRNPCAVHLNVQAVQVDGGGGDIKNIMRTAANNVVVQIIVVLIVLHIFHLRELYYNT